MDSFVKNIPTLHLSLFFLSCVRSNRTKQVSYFIMEPREFIAGKTKAMKPLSCVSAYRATCLQQFASEPLVLGWGGKGFQS